MSVELQCLAWSVVLGLAHILIAGHARSAEAGIAWNISARDNGFTGQKVLTGRLFRAQANFFETFPLFAAAVLITACTQLYSACSYWGALLYVSARVVYLPLYALGVPVLRSIVWTLASTGILLVLCPLLF